MIRSWMVIAASAMTYNTLKMMVRMESETTMKTMEVNRRGGGFAHGHGAATACHAAQAAGKTDQDAKDRAFGETLHTVGESDGVHGLMHEFTG